MNERILSVHSCWKRTEIQLKFLRRVTHTLDEDFLVLQGEVLQILESKLKRSGSKLNKIMRGGRFKYARMSDSLDKTIEDLRTWQANFDPSWFLVLRISNKLIDEELSRSDSKEAPIVIARGLRDALKEDPEKTGSIFLPEDDLRNAHLQAIEFSTAQLMQRSGSETKYLLDSVAGDTEIRNSIQIQDVRGLATKLRSADPLAHGLLRCRGVVKRLDVSKQYIVSFDFIFRIPESMGEPKGLRGLLMTADTEHSLSDRFNVARQLARSVSYVHTYGFVHKNVRPETIVVFGRGDLDLGIPFLLGFERSRSAGGRTLRHGDEVWEKNLYRHPQRQGIKPEEDFVMQHDIYSLGVCLLEIGLWKSLLDFPESGGTPVPSPITPAASVCEKNQIRKATLMKESLVQIAKEALPKRMGTKYTQVVVNCLTCLDGNNADFGDESEFNDADGVSVGVRYIEKVR